MKIANVGGRLALIEGGLAVDVASASKSRFSSEPQEVYREWDAFVAWAATAHLDPGEPYTPDTLRAPAPSPRQVIGIGLNYRDHAEEANLPIPDDLVVFTKFPSSIAGPHETVPIPPGDVQVDWEVELVVVIGRTAHQVRESAAWQHVAGLTLGQDFSERRLQMAAPQPQYSFGKSFPKFSPFGPLLVTPDEFADRNDIELGCSVNGEPVQHSSTSSLIFPVARTVARLSEVLTLEPGDIIFTGTTGGVGLGMTPQRFLSPGDVVTSFATGIGEMRHEFT